MMLWPNSQSLYNNRQKIQFVEYIKESLKYVHSLQYQTPKHILEYTSHLRSELKAYTELNSPIYKNINGIISKNDLLDKNNWYTSIDYAAAKTSGSTTGSPFEYRRWVDVYQKIEGDIHYKSILTEYELEPGINILYFMLDQSVDKTTEQIVKKYQTNNALISHGARHRATIHEVIKNKNYFYNYFKFYDDLVKYISQNNINVILVPGNGILELYHNIRRLNHDGKLCDLISSTGSKTPFSELDWMVKNGNIVNWCDHMRCWDGGVTFFTCKYHTHHLLDGLSWAWSYDNKLISDDYYSLASPFVNYWNGDYATISDEFEICKCGRYYRKMSIDRTRTTIINGVTNRNIIKSFEVVRDIIPLIKRVVEDNRFIRIFTTEPISTEYRNLIRAKLNDFEVNFISEN